MMKKLHIAIALMIALLASSAFAAVDVQLAITPGTINAGDQVSMFMSIANMGDADAVAALTVSISFMGYEVGPLNGDLPLAAGQELSHEFSFVAPALPVSGTLIITVTATAGSVTNTATATVDLVGTGLGGYGGLNTLGDTLVGQLSGAPAGPQSATFGDLKALFR